LSSSLYMFYVLVALVISIDIHEFFHAWMANYLGDSTAKRMGRLSLNPLVHLDPVGTIMMVMAAFSGIGIGWGKPVPVNPHGGRLDPRTMMGITGIAGPFSNLLLALVVAIPLRAGHLPSGLVRDLLTVLVGVNISLASFNLLPIPPLDGYSVLMAILNAIRRPWANAWFQALARLEAQGSMLLLLLIMFGSLTRINILGILLGPPIHFFTRLILGR
jgi:Zn-dependent protease